MYFSVKSSVKIAGKVYTPCICYPLSEFLTPTVNKMVEEGKAVIYKDKVFFQNGKVLVKKPAVKEVLTTEKKPSKKSKKEEKLEPEEFVKEVEEIVTPDESEGF